MSAFATSEGSAAHVVMQGMGVVRLIEGLETASDKPIKHVAIMDCGELSATDSSTWAGPSIPALEVLPQIKSCISFPCLKLPVPATHTIGLHGL